MNRKMNAFISDLMAQMTIDEKIGQLNMVAPGGSVVTGEAVNSNIEEKIRQGLVGSILNVPSPHNSGATETIHQIQTMAIKESRLGIPLMFWLDIIHGHKTIFPVGMANSWDFQLIEKAARVQAIEGSADGYHGTFSPMADIVRDPRWGRVAEILIEDPYLAGLNTAAQVRGYQGENLKKTGTLLSCIKHFAAYGAAEAGREYNTVDMSLMKLHSVYLAGYKAGIKAGAGAVMAAFNDLNGMPCHANKYLLTDVLRGEWGFEGMTVGDYTGVTELRAHGLGDISDVAVMALKSGLDVDMVGEAYTGTLKKSLEDGKIVRGDIDRACRRVLEAKYKLGLFADPYRGLDVKKSSKKIFLPAYRRLARDLAARSCVLLQNENTALPLKKRGTIALIGPLANDQLNMQGTWAVSANSDDSVALLTGMCAQSGGAKILYAKGCNITDDPVEAERVNVHGVTAPIDARSPEEMIHEALGVAEQADIVVIALGEAKEHSGECSSRTNIGLPSCQKELLDELHKTGKKIVLVLMSGRPLTIEDECKKVDAVLWTGFGGTEAGNGIADVLFNQHNPSGKLAMTWPRNAGQIPIYYARTPTGRPVSTDPKSGIVREFEKFKACYLDCLTTPLFAFGHGLSYTDFHYGPVQMNKNSLSGGKDILKASVCLTNVGPYAGEETVQLYIGDPVASITRPVKELKRHQKVVLQPGESRDVIFEITPEDLKFIDPQLRSDWETGEFVIHIGTSSDKTNGASVFWQKSEAGISPAVRVLP